MGRVGGGPNGAAIGPSRRAANASNAAASVRTSDAGWNGSTFAEVLFGPEVLIGISC